VRSERAPRLRGCASLAGAALALAAAATLAACAGKGAPVCQPVFSWATPAYGCAAGAAPAAERRDARDPLPLATGPTPVEPPPVTEPAEPELAHLGDRTIELDGKIEFETGRAVLTPASESLLDHVAVLLFDHPELLEVRIEGHTDAQGSNARNLKLSQQRADSVRTYLVNAGVEPERLQAKGFGETRPLADNRTAAGRDRNRRVELVILHRGP
jgi:outer membrane protein OmpA-like peptidoglycan-associated protein